MKIPEYTLSLLFWIVPLVLMGGELWRRRSLGGIQRKALAINLVILAGVGFVLDLLFAHLFFKFPDPSMTMGFNIRGIPVEEFLFYLLGFWFIIILYVFNDELFLSRYNRDDGYYVRFARRIRRIIYLSATRKSVLWLLILVSVFVILKRLLHPEGAMLPGYILFLTAFAYVPYLFFWKITKSLVNRQALVFTIVVTTLISIVWEVTLALPRGYWNYNHDYMLGISIPAWDSLPVEAVTVWIFCSLIVLLYEYTKVILQRRKAAHSRKIAQE
jgi:hypothetical protein